MDGKMSQGVTKPREGSPSRSGKGKKITDDDLNKPIERKRGLGIADLERIRTQTEIDEYLKNAQCTPLLTGIGVRNLEKNGSSSRSINIMSQGVTKPREGSSSRSGQGKRITDDDLNKPIERKRGLGIAALERIRIQTEIDDYLKNAQCTPLLPGIGVRNLEKNAVGLNKLPSFLFPSSTSIRGSQPYPYSSTANSNIPMVHGMRGNVNYRQFLPSSISQPTGTPEAEFHSSPSKDMASINPVKLQLFEAPNDQEEEHVHSEREGDGNGSVESTSRNSNGVTDVDLELKL